MCLLPLAQGFSLLSSCTETHTFRANTATWNCLPILLVAPCEFKVLDCKEIKPVSPKGNQPRIVIGLMLKLKLKYFGHLILRADSLKNDWRQKEKGKAENEMIGWHHWLSGHNLSKLREIVKDWEAWRAAVHGVTESQTRLKWLNTNFLTKETGNEAERLRK